MGIGFRFRRWPRNEERSGARGEGGGKEEEEEEGSEESPLESRAFSRFE